MPEKDLHSTLYIPHSKFTHLLLISPSQLHNSPNQYSNSKGCGLVTGVDGVAVIGDWR